MSETVNITVYENTPEGMLAAMAATELRLVQKIDDALLDSEIIGGVTTSSAIPADGNIHAIGVGPGTYSNWGGMEIPVNNIGTLKRVNGVYSVSLMALNLTEYAKTTDLKSYVRNVQHVLLAGASVSKTGSYIYTLTGMVGFFHGNGKYAIIEAGVYDVSQEGKCLVVSNINKNIFYDGESGSNKAPILIPIYKDYSQINENDVVLISRGYAGDVQTVWDSLLLPDFAILNKVNRSIQPIFLIGGNVTKSIDSYTLTGGIGFLHGSGKYVMLTPGTYEMSAFDCWVIPSVDNSKNYDGSDGSEPIITPLKVVFASVKKTDTVVMWRDGENNSQSIWDNILFSKQASGNSFAYDKVKDRALYANKLFLFEDEPLAIHKDSLFVDVTSSKKVKVSILSSTANGAQRLEVQNPLLLNTSSLGSTAEIIIEQTNDKNVTIKKTVNIKKANKASKAGLIRNILMFGDSLTQGNNGVNSSPIYQVKNRIAALGMTANMVGSFNIETLAADAIGSYRGEGRGYWQYLNFVGMGNSPYGQVITPKFTGGGTTKFQNPFLRLATNTDYSAHPTWCFRNTGVHNELSYSSDTVKTGNFYIFDFANYLTVQNVPTPDIITIALGTNDWQESLSNDLNKSVLACEIMVTKIREALPGVKILIVPANALSISRIEWNTHFAILAEKIITKIETLFSADSNIHTLPLFAHSSRWASVQTATSQGVISVDNNFTAYTVSPDVHSIDNFTGEGMESYMDALLPAIVYCY